MTENYFHHALKVRPDICIGCTHCMSICPTNAIKVRAGKAIVDENRCVDCGMCMRACPVSAIIVDQDDFQDIFKYNQRVALVPAILSGQFPEDVPVEQIYSALIDMGFTHVFEVEHGAPILLEHYNSYIEKKDELKPLISSFCPAIVRLIQVKFPSLVDNIIHLKPALDISAIYCRKYFKDKGIPDKEIGVFYVTPCAAKIAAIKSPAEGDQSHINGVINMDVIYNRIYKNIKKNSGKCSLPVMHNLSASGVLWSLTHGEADMVAGKTLAIDEIHNVIEFLEKVENGDFGDIDFLELRACDESCAGGVLAPANRFLSAARLKKRAEKAGQEQFVVRDGDIETYKSFLSEKIGITRIIPRSIVLDEDFSQAIEKMRKVNEIMKLLPLVDCGACGEASCRALAEDIVQGQANLLQCVFIQRKMEANGATDSEDGIKAMKAIWGDEKLYPCIIKKEENNEG